MDVSEEEFQGFSSDDSILDPNINFNELNSSSVDFSGENSNVSISLKLKIAIQYQQLHS